MKLKKNGAMRMSVLCLKYWTFYGRVLKNAKISVVRGRREGLTSFFELQFVINFLSHKGSLEIDSTWIRVPQRCFQITLPRGPRCKAHYIGASRWMALNVGDPKAQFKPLLAIGAPLVPLVQGWKKPNISKLHPQWLDTGGSFIFQSITIILYQNS